MTYLRAGEWEIDANGQLEILRIEAVDELGRVSGVVGDQPITGWWSERARRLSFMRDGRDANSDHGYEGYAWDERVDIDAARRYHLAGSFETFGGGGGAKDRQTFGWFATLRNGIPVG